MPPRKKGKAADGAASPDAGGDRISALPDDALHHLLSFLPAEDAVRTCVLARRWRHLWRSATGLRIGFSHGDTEPPSVDSLQSFVNHLLLLRKGDSCIHTCELRLRPRIFHAWSAEEEKNLNLWIRHVVDREVRMLRLEIHDNCESCHGFHIDRPVSQHLKMLALISVSLTSPCNFSNCPNLKQLEIAKSYICEAPQISSKSLKHLSISDCYFSYEGLHMHTLICTPNLVSLRLDGHFASVPVLCSMPSLKEAFARDHTSDCLNEDCVSCADEYNHGIPDESDYKNRCFLLQGLSEAENLTLMCDHYGGPQYKVEMIGRYNQMERPATILKHLKEIEVKCDEVNKQVHKVLKFLGTFGIHFLFK